MEDTAEARFVQNFIRKARRERLRHELATPEKRYEGISRFCHHARDLLEPSRILMEGEDLDRRAEFLRFMRAHDELCLVLTPGMSAQRLTLPLREAVAMAAAEPDAAVIIGSSFAVVFGEPAKGGRGKFLLSEK